jgi:hypothetical protein
MFTFQLLIFGHMAVSAIAMCMSSWRRERGCNLHNIEPAGGIGSHNVIQTNDGVNNSKAALISSLTRILSIQAEASYVNTVKAICRKKERATRGNNPSAEDEQKVEGAERL